MLPQIHLAKPLSVSWIVQPVAHHRKWREPQARCADAHTMYICVRVYPEGCGFEESSQSHIVERGPLQLRRKLFLAGRYVAPVCGSARDAR